MKFALAAAVAALSAQSVSAHCAPCPLFHALLCANPPRYIDIWNTLIAGSTTSSAAVRQPVNNSPVTSVTAAGITCNTNPGAASATVSVAAGSTVSIVSSPTKPTSLTGYSNCVQIGFKLDNTIYHLGPAAIYLGQVPAGKTAATWDGSGANWFKVLIFSLASHRLLANESSPRLRNGAPSSAPRSASLISMPLS